MELKYYIIPGRYQHNDSGLKLHDTIFKIWYSFWSKLLSELPDPSALNANEFFRQSYISALTTSTDQIIGFSLHTVFNLKSQADCHNSFFRHNYDSAILTQLHNLNLDLLLTFEYLTILPEYRKNQLGFSVAPVLAGLSHRLQKALGVSAAMASCRADFKVDQIAKAFGAIELSNPGIVYGIQTQNMLSLTQNLREPKDLSPILENLWSQKIILPKSRILTNEALVSAA